MRFSTAGIAGIGVGGLFLVCSQLAVLYLWSIIGSLQDEIRIQSRILNSFKRDSSQQEFPCQDEVKLKLKLFSSARHPFEIRPFFKEANRAGFDQISLTTICTSERMHMLPGLAESWGRHISLTFHIPAGPTGDVELEALEELWRNSDALQSNVDLHLIIDAQPNQFNLWRNIARFYTKASAVILMDVDFLVDPDLGDLLEQRWISEIEPALFERNFVYVIPSFEFLGDNNGATPKSKDELVGLMKEGKIGPFHQNWFHAQGHTNYSRWVQEEEDYEIETYHFKYEPYVLIPQTAPFCDERFIGYGSNKCACIHEIWASGFHFRVLSRSFVLHRAHMDGTDNAAAQKQRERENKINIQTMKRFLEDVELKYSGSKRGTS